MGVNRSAAAAILLAALALPAAAAPSSDASTIDGIVTHVVDGDGLRIGAIEIRLCGIDAPETRRPGGRESTLALTALVLGQRLVCRPVGEGTPCDGRSKRKSYDRIVAQCFLGDQDVAGAQVRSGHAVDWPRFSGGAYR